MTPPSETLKASGYTLVYVPQADDTWHYALSDGKSQTRIDAQTMQEALEKAVELLTVVAMNTEY